MKIPEQLRLSLILLILVLLFFLAIKHLFPLITPFILGLLIAYLIETPVAFVEHRFRFPREIAVLFVLLFTVIMIGFLLTLLFAHLYQETRDLLLDLPGKIGFLEKGLEKLILEIATWLQLPRGFWDKNKLSPEKLLTAASSLLERALNIFRGFPVFLLNLFLSGFAAYFLSRDKFKFKQLFLSFLPVEWEKPVLKVHDEILRSGWGFLKVQLMLAVITGLLSTLLLGFFGFSKPWLIGITLGLFDFVPLIGPSTIYFPWIGWHLATGRLRTVIYLVVAFLITLGLRQIIEVRLVGEKLGLHPLLVLLSIYLGIRLFGIYGFLLGPVFFVVIRSFYQGLIPFFTEDGFRFNEGD